jgi:phosphoglycolate phosphatase-like HAD superfamily hydrolase
MRSNGNGPIVAIDVDGTLGDYHGHFLRFAADWYGREMPDPAEINPGLPLHKFMRTSKATYRQCKLAYRQGGLERSMPVYDGANELCRSVRKAGAELWLCTTRPYLKYDQLYKDTLHWLRRHRIPYDAVIHGPNKYRDLVRTVARDRVAAVLDDLPELITQADTIGLDTILRDQPYNSHFDHHWRVYDMEDAENAILLHIKKWKENNGR